MLINKKKNFFYNKKILVAGGTGTIGIPLVEKLIKLKAKVTIASIDSPKLAKNLFGSDVQFIRADLTNSKNCLKVTKNQDYVFNLIGIKGSVGIGQTKAASFLVPMLLFQTYLMDASFKNKVKRFLFVSSICAYPQSNIPKVEETIWDGALVQNDRIPGLAKRIGEIQGEAYFQEHGWDAVRIVRPSNVYGPFDDFNPKTAQVIPALISRMVKGENPIKVWGNGSQVRDFIFSKDVAGGILLAMAKAPICTPINLGSGEGYTIKSIAEVIAKNVGEHTKIVWDPSKPSGDPVRILSTKKAESTLGFKATTKIAEGIKKTIKWYRSDYEYFMKLKRRFTN